MAEAFPVSATATGSVATLAIYLDRSSTTQQLALALYADANGHPGTLLTQAGTAQPQAGAWNKIAVPAANVVQGTRYWIAVLGSGSGAIQFRDTNRGYCSSETSMQTTLASFPASWSTGHRWATCRMSAYGSGSATSPVSVAVAVLPSAASLPLGKSKQFAANVSGTSNTAVSWKAGRGSVDATGVYTAPMSPGSDLVTATSLADTSQSASASVTVDAAVAVTITISPSSTSLSTGGTQQFTATVSGATNTGVSWSAPGGSISGSGLYIAPTAAGSYTVTATSVADSTKFASATVTVSAPSAVAVSVSPSSTSLSTGGTKQFTAAVSNSTNQTVTWSAVRGSLTSAGLYTAPATVGNGTDTVTATSQADSTKSASATVTVSAPATVAVSVSPGSASLSTGGTQQFTASVSGSSNTAVTWSATGGTISSGLFTAPASAGTYTVTATSVADGSKSASATVTVSAPATVAVSVSPTTASLSTGGTKQFAASVSGSSNTGVNWSATGGSVSSSGMFTAPSTAGNFTVTATSAADSSKSASASVTVTDPPPTSGGSAGCGATNGGAAPYDQSQCGNVGGNFPAVGGSISSCGSYSGTLTLSQDISAGAGTSVCLTVNTGATINLGGHTVTGLIRLGDPASGTHIYNGTVRCSASSAGISPNEACVFGNLSGPMTAPLIIDHITLINTNTASGTGSQTFLLDWNPSSVSAASPQVQLSYITSNAPAVSNSPRTGNLWINGQPTWTADLHNLDLTCGSSSDACQGLTLWNGRAHFYNNRVTMSKLSLPQDGRAFICDGDSEYCEANNNYIDAQNNRAFRLRKYSTSEGGGPYLWHDNLIDHIQNNITRAAIHLCDPDNTSELVNVNNAMFYHNTLKMGGGGTGVWAIHCASPGPVFRDNVIKCLAAGNCGTIAVPTADYGASATFVTIYDNTLDPGTAGPQAPSGTTVNYCNTGACSSNGGSCSLISPCPAAQ